jgi:hypothetical protein
MQGEWEESIRHMLITWMITCVMVLKEAKLNCTIDDRGRVISTGSCYAQLLWMRATLLNYGIKFDEVSFLCDNGSVMKIATNPVQHSRTKHNDIHHHFTRGHQAKRDITIESVGTKDQLADIFTKPLDEARFCKLRNKFNILDYSNMS